METLSQIVLELRRVLCEYRYMNKEVKVSTHVSAIEIALSLVEIGLEDHRAVSQNEEIWFKAGYHLSYIFPSGDEWEKISLLYDKMVDKTQSLNYFR